MHIPSGVEILLLFVGQTKSQLIIEMENDWVDCELNADHRENIYFCANTMALSSHFRCMIFEGRRMRIDPLINHNEFVFGLSLSLCSVMIIMPWLLHTKYIELS